MKKVLLTLALCSLVAVAGCGKKATNEVPKSVSIYQQLNLSEEQNKKLQDIRTVQRQKMEIIRKDLEKKRAELLDLDGTKKFSDEQKKANHEKYRQAATEMREKLAAERAAYDAALMNILDNGQKKTYQKYLNQREKERNQREQEYKKRALEGK